VIHHHLPALQVVLPLLAAPCCVLLHRARWAWWLTLTVSVISFAITLGLLRQALVGGTVSYFLGGWAAPWGIEYRIDELSVFVLLVISTINVVAIVYARASVEQEIDSDRIYLFYTGWLLSLTGLLGMTVTADAFNLFVFLEISSLSGYLLVSLGNDRRSLTAAFQYLVVGTIGATFILIGVGLLYMMTGTLNMIDLAARLPQVMHTRTVLVALAFLVVGIGIKLALFPLHLWLPNAYTYAPSAVTVFLAGTATKVGVYVLYRFIFGVFGVQFSFGAVHLQHVFLTLAILGILGGSIVALYQTNAKRILAYSSIAQVGYMVAGIGLASITGLTSSILHLFNHALMKAALFMALGAMFYRLNSVMLDDLEGIAQRMPWTMAAFVAAGLSLIGVPLTVGFVSKWYLILAALERGWWWLAGVVLVSSLLALVYIWRIAEVAYFKPLSQTGPAVTEAPMGLLAPMWALIVLNFYFGIDASFTTTVASRAAAMLLGSGI